MFSETRTYKLTTPYVEACHNLYRHAAGCEIAGKSVMLLFFRPRLVDRSTIIRFGTYQWDAIVDKIAGAVTVSADNTDIIDKVVRYINGAY